ANVNEICIERGIVDSVERTRISNMVENERRRSRQAGETFDLQFSTAQAIHAAKVKHNEKSLAPAPRGTGQDASAKPTAQAGETLAEAVERLRHRPDLDLRNLADPNVGVYAGDLGCIQGGGPAR